MKTFSLSNPTPRLVGVCLWLGMAHVAVMAQKAPLKNRDFFKYVPALYTGLPLNQEYGYIFDAHVSRLDSVVITSWKPYNAYQTNESAFVLADQDSNRLTIHRRWLWRKVKQESLIMVDSGNFSLRVDPVINVFGGMERFNGAGPRYQNTRGFLLQGNIGAKVSFFSSFFENQAFLTGYQDSWVRATGVMPGSGRVKRFKTSGYDYAMASGMVVVKPLKMLSLSYGHDKLFIGEGYRSLLLSDNAFNFPFARIATTFWKNRIHYQVVYAGLQSLNRIPVYTTPETTFQRKTAAFHQLGLIPSRWLQVVLFEGTIWQTWTKEGSKPLDYAMLNPIIGINSATQGSDGVNNTIAGFNLRFSITNNIILYYQGVFDDIRTNRFGYQAGLKCYNLFRIRNLTFLSEFNKVKPYTYGHSNPLQSYTHYNQPLAHPLGAGFSEYVGVLNYRWHDVWFQMKGSVASVLHDQGGSHFGKNIMLSDTLRSDPTIARQKSGVINGEATLSYLINRRSKLNFVIGYQSRMYFENISLTPDDRFGFGFVGLRTSIGNQYFDF